MANVDNDNDIDTDVQVNNSGNLVESNYDSIWSIRGIEYFKVDNTPTTQLLDNNVYLLRRDNRPFEITFLAKQSDDFEFDYKVYGVESELIERIYKSYVNKTGNFGVLFNGIKGTGKTVTAKILCNMLKMPVIIIDRKIQDAVYFLNSIEQDVIIFIDEYEKVYEQSSEMLPIMDGASNSKFRRFFILTTNSLYINDNLKQRPGRIRYIKTFKDLSPEITEEIIDDFLVHKSFKKELKEFISSLEIITIDIVKAIIEEVNIHNDSPSKFADVFNVSKLSGKYNLDLVDKEGKFIPLYKGIVTNYRSFESDNCGENNEFWLSINGVGYFKIIEPIDFSTVKINIDISSINQHQRTSLLEKIKECKPDIKISGKNKESLQFNDLVLRIENAQMFHTTYRSYL